jgi:hypothetical protein
MSFESAGKVGGGEIVDCARATLIWVKRKPAFVQNGMQQPM